METDALIQSAVRAKANAIAPISHFAVGSAVLTASGAIYDGCNIESSSLGLTICAERVAIFKALSSGEKNIVAVAVASDAPDICPPCGACRQILWDFARGAMILLVTRNGAVKRFSIDELYPHAFDQDLLPNGSK